MTRGPLRLEYEARVMALRGRADAMHRDGLSLEAIAKALHAERRTLCEAFKERTPEPQRTRIARRTYAIYGDPFGPSVEYLRAKGKNWDEIIESASRPGSPPGDICDA
jgi:AraC-like DNA-binding protein